MCVYSNTSYFIKRAVKRSISGVTENWSVFVILSDDDNDSFINFSASSSEIFSSSSNSTNGKISAIFTNMLQFFHNLYLPKILQN